MAWRKPTNVQEWLAILARHKKKAFFPAILVMIAVMVHSHWISRTYRATAEFRRFNDLALRHINSRTLSMNLSPVRRTMVYDLKKESTLEKIIDRLGLAKDLPIGPDGKLTRAGELKKREMVRRFQRRVRVSFRVKSAQQDLVAVSFNHRDRLLPPKVVNKLVEYYIRETRGRLDLALTTTKKFFDDAVASYQLQVNELDTKKLRFEGAHPMLRANSPIQVSNRLEQLKGKQEQFLEKRMFAQNELRLIVAWIADQPENVEKITVGDNPEYTQLTKRLTPVLIELDQHYHRWNRTQEHPAVKKAESLKAQLIKLLSETPRKIEIAREIVPNQVLKDHQIRAKVLEGSIETIEHRMGELNGLIDDIATMNRNFFPIRQEYQLIERELEGSRKQLAYWEDNLRETTLALNAEVNQHGVRFDFFRRGEDLNKPSKPRLPGIIGVAVFLGLGIAIVIIVLSELLDHSLRSVEQTIDDLKMPVLGMVNEIVVPRQRRRRKIIAWAVYPPLTIALAVVLLLSIGAAWLSLDDPGKFEQMWTHPRQYITHAIRGIRR